MSEERPEESVAMWKRKGFAMAMGFAGLLITFAYVALQELR